MRARNSIVLISFIFVFLGLVLKLFILQIVQGTYYRDLSNSNRTRTVVIHAPRGAIFDRFGAPLVFNIPGFRKFVGGKTVLIGKDEALSLIAKGKNDLSYDSLRQYPHKEAFAHVLGYVGEVSQEELKKREFLDYSPSDLVGKMGIERTYEKLLAGVDGKELVEVDSKGNVVRKLGKTDPVLGQNITTTLDLNLQKKAYEAMKNVEKGAVLVSAPNGEILTLFSKPSFDPNLFTLPTIYQETSSKYTTLSQVFEDPMQPLLNRAISGEYPPGSTFKLIVAAAGLEGKVIDENFEVEDVGVFSIGPFSFSNWYFTQYGKKDGEVNVVSGIKRSNDIFFYKLAEMVGVDNISSTAHKFGLGQALGIDLSGEADGLVPTLSWKKKTIGEAWFLGDTYNYGIGQGYVLATPLQVNTWTQVIANGGILYQPHLLKNEKQEAKSQKFLSEKTVSLIREGMVESCSIGGVAWPLFEFKVPVACKTGTAQHGEKNELPHAWITLFAPANDPQIVVTVLAESSGEGSNVAAPIAKKILEEWFSR